MAGRKLARQRAADNKPVEPLADPVPKNRSGKRHIAPPPVLSPEMYERVVIPPVEDEAIPDIAPRFLLHLLRTKPV